MPTGSRRVLKTRRYIGVNASLKVELRAELHEPPVEYLRRLAPPRVVRAEERDGRVRVEQIVSVHIQLEALLAKAKDFSAPEIELVNARTVQRIRLRERNGDRRGSRQWASERRLDLG